MAKRKVRTTSSNPNIPSVVSQEVSQRDILRVISGGAKELETMDVTLKPVRYVPTIFTSFNRAIQIGGGPVGCTYVIHGPPGGGKTAFKIGMCNSFVRQGHAAAIIDAEHALDKKWVVHLKTEMDGILFKQPDTFENAIDLVDGWIQNFREGKRKGDIPDDRAFLIGVDTIHKLAPRKELDDLKSKNKGKGAENINKGWGRFRANMIKTWIDSLTPKVGKSDIAFLALAHEKKRQDQVNFGEDDYSVKGGTALLYEAMVRLRITFASKLLVPKGNRKIVVGREHTVSVEKNKVGAPFDIARFYISNGRGIVPKGFDLAQEAFVEATTIESRKSQKIIKVEGSYYTLPDDSRHNGKDATMAYLRENPECYDELVDILNETIEMKEYDTEDDETERDGDSES